MTAQGWNWLCTGALLLGVLGGCSPAADTREQTAKSGQDDKPATTPAEPKAAEVRSPAGSTDPAKSPLIHPSAKETRSRFPDRAAPVQLPPKDSGVVPAGSAGAAPPGLLPQPVEDEPAGPAQSAVGREDKPQSPDPVRQPDGAAWSNPLRGGGGRVSKPEVPVSRPKEKTGDPGLPPLEKPNTNPPPSQPLPPPEEKPLPPSELKVRPLSESPGTAAAVGTKPGKPKTNKNSGVPFDPIKENGKIFDGWPQPKLALIATGRQDGYLEPCGCAGLDRMKGGMSRRYSMFKDLRARGWPVVGVDVGGIAKGFGRQSELKFQIAIEGMRKMGYSGAGFGIADLQLPTEEVLAAVLPVNNQPSPFVSANVGLITFDESVLPMTKAVRAGGRTVGITSVFGKDFQKHIAGNASVQYLDPVEALRQRLPELKKKADFLVLLAYASKEESIALARQFPEFAVVVTAGGPQEPPSHAEEIAKGTQLIEVGEKGMYAVVLGIYDDPQQPIRYQRVPLDSRFAQSPEMHLLMDAYQQQVKSEVYAKLIERAPPDHPQLQVAGRFVGSDKCKSCHEESYRVWRKSGHFLAYKTLTETRPPRQFDPECVSCHVVGWHPTKHFPYESGFRNIENTPNLANVGCETCHGPGEGHVDAEMGSNLALRDQRRKVVAITKAEAADPTSKKMNCWNCHDGDNSPEFKFDVYWPHVEHREEK